MQEIIIDIDFQYLLPVLSEKTFNELEANILENGIRDPLVLWDNILIDGYNRYYIATKHDLPFKTVSMEFDSRYEVVIWIIRNQVSRRNLTPYQMRYFRGLHFHAERRIDKNEEGTNQHTEVKRQNGGKPQTLATSKKLADIYNVSSRTIERDSRLADALIAIGEVSPDAKQSILLGATKITRNELDAILSGSESVVTEIAESIDSGTFEETRKNNAKNDDKSLDSSFSKISNLIQKELKGLTKTYTSSEVKNALRSHIASLEDIYMQL